MADKPDVWTISAVLAWAAEDFRARGIERPRLDAEVLLASALGVTRVQLVIDAQRPLVPAELASFRELVQRRRTHEPVAYLVGRREFYGRMFRVDRRVLIPRPDTETLVDVALARTRAVSMCMRALDLCTGSGCVAVTLGRERPTACVHATDASEGALAVARDNALRLGAYNVSFEKGDLYEAVDPRCCFDLIVANPPYIASKEVETLTRDIRDFEPRVALDGGVDGLAVLRRIVEGAPRFLVEGGTLAVEVGAGEAEAVAELLVACGFASIGVTRDYAQIPRVVDGSLGAGAPQGRSGRAT